jgi:hypothetical protein
MRVSPTPTSRIAPWCSASAQGCVHRVANLAIDQIAQKARSPQTTRPDGSPDSIGPGEHRPRIAPMFRSIALTPQNTPSSTGGATFIE